MLNLYRFISSLKMAPFMAFLLINIKAYILFVFIFLFTPIFIFSQNVGVGTTTPAEKLEIFGGGVKADSIQLTNGANTGYILQSKDGSGNAQWVDPALISGVNGVTGATGVAGNSIQFQYKFDNSTSIGTVSSNYIQFDNWGAAITKVGISYYPNLLTGVDIEDYLKAQDDPTNSGIKSTLIIRSLDNIDDYFIFGINSISNTGISYLEYDITLIDKTSTLSFFSNNENLAISFSLSGNLGATGPTGQTGTIGATGPSGALVSGTLGQTLFHDGSDWTATSNLYHDNANVGVGLTSPLAKFHVKGSGNSSGSDAVLVANSSGDEILTIRNDGVIIIADDTDVRIQSESAGGFRLLGEQGNTPGKPSIGFFSMNGIDDGGGGMGIYRPLANAMAFSTLSTERLRITPSGKIGIGTQSPSHLFHVNGVARSSQSTWATSSDQRVKKNIKSIKNGLSLLEKFRPVIYEWKENYKKENKELKDKNYGFISQEVEKIIPEMVTIVEEQFGEEVIKDFKVLNTDALIPILVSAMKEQQDIINELINKVDVQKLDINILKSEVEALQNIKVEYNLKSQIE
jgi:hypothetical protein